MDSISPLLGSTPRRHLVRKRLWQAGFGLAMFTIALIVGNFLGPKDQAITGGMIGQDFTAFYTGGTFARQHQFAALYDVEAVKAFEQQVGRAHNLGLRDAYGPWWNPPFYAWVFAPLSALPYPSAVTTWIGINILCAIAAMILLARMMPRADGWRTWGLVPLLILASFPFSQAICHGQNTCTSLLLLACVIAAWRKRMAIITGALAGLLFYKPQLGALVALAVAGTLGWRSLIGLAITGAALLAVTLITMPGTLSLYLHKLPTILHFMQVEHMYLWERHITLKAFWRLLLQGRGPGEATVLVNALWIASELVLAGGLVFAWTRWRTQRGSGAALDRFIAATIAAMPLLMPFYFDYDGLLVSAAAVLVAGDIVSEGAARLRNSDRIQLACWSVLFLWLNFNGIVGATTRVNLAVPLYAALAGLMIARCASRAVAAAEIDEDTRRPSDAVCIAA